MKSIFFYLRHFMNSFWTSLMEADDTLVLINRVKHWWYHKPWSFLCTICASGLIYISHSPHIAVAHNATACQLLFGLEWCNIFDYPWPENMRVKLHYIAIKENVLFGDNIIIVMSRCLRRYVYIFIRPHTMVPTAKIPKYIRRDHKVMSRIHRWNRSPLWVTNYHFTISLPVAVDTTV